MDHSAYARGRINRACWPGFCCSAAGVSSRSEDIYTNVGVGLSGIDSYQQNRQ
ncbi:hypothetical protein M758_1G313100 [Ceratodon purpureus]|nr:hypothetical protein M758_1G313100 [Ceratodon purpureus]